MATEPIDSLRDQINKLGLSTFLNSDPAAGSLPYVDSNKKLAATTLVASEPVYIDSNEVPQAGDIPFAMPLAAGATDSSFSTFAITGRATGSANELMHLNLVAGANATATIAGFIRTTITDQAGVITDGAYYMPFYTLG